MNKTEIILVSVAFAVFGFRLYRKFIKKDYGKPETDSKSASSLSSLKEDDYEPYSKK